jgi:hypothetical protein
VPLSLRELNNGRNQRNVYFVANIDNHDAKINNPMNKGILTNVLTYLRVMHKKVNMLQSRPKFLTETLKSLNDNTKAQEDQIELDDCELDFFSFNENEVSETLKEDLEEEKKKYYQPHTTFSRQVIKPGEELQFKRNEYSLGYEHN